MLLEEGRICIKRYGRDAGSKAIVTKVLDHNFVMIVSSLRNKKERRCNTAHLEFLSEKIDPNNKDAINKALGIEERKEHPKKDQAKKR
jgi:ribosomal protein L14E/L6E/L27E